MKSFSADILIVLPFVLLLLTALLQVLLWKSRKLQHIVQIIAMLLYLMISLAVYKGSFNQSIIVTQAGGWKAPYGISLVADQLAGITLVITAIVFLSCSLFSIPEIDSRRLKFGYYPLLNILALGISGVILTGDLFNMFVWMEVLLISSFVLLVSGGEVQQLEGTVKYSVLNMLSSFLMLMGVGFIYGLTGTLNLADITEKTGTNDFNFQFHLVSAVFITSVGIKTAIFPLHFWAAASYPTPPSPIMSLFGGILTKIGFYIFLRLSTLFFRDTLIVYSDFVLVISAFTMLTGVLGAIAYHDVRKILSVHVVSQVGYLMMGLAVFTLNSIAGSIYFLMHIILVKTNLFLISAIIRKERGSFNIDHTGSGLEKNPLLALLFLLNAFSLAGVPPLSGFWAKLFIIRSAVISGHYVMAAIGLLTGLFTLISMTKIWKEVFWKDENQYSESDINEYRKTDKLFLYLPVIFLTLLILLISIFPDFVYSLSAQAAEQVLNQKLYINNILDP